MYTYNIVSYHMLASTYTHAAATVLKRITTARSLCRTLGIGYAPPTHADRKGKSFFHNHESDRGLGHFKVVSVGV